MNRHYWFGDSWVAGAELELEVSESEINEYVFPKLISRYFNAECINLGESGISNNVFPILFSKIVNEINVHKDTIFFCLTASHRMSMLDDNKNPLTILSSINDESRRKSEHPYWKEWYKYFDTAPQRLYNYECMINLLYHWCKNIGINFYFINLFTTENDSMIDTTTPDVWLLPKNQCISQFILPVVDNDIGGIVTEDRKWLSDTQWEEQRQAITKYIRPCFCHPNMQGHQKIADALIKLLEGKLVSKNLL